MADTPENKRERCDDLLVQHALHGLDAAEQQELDSLVRLFEISETDRFENVVGVLNAAFHETEQALDQQLDEGLKTQIMQEAGDYIDSPDSLTNADAQSATSSQVGLNIRHDNSVGSTREAIWALVTAASLLFALASYTGLSQMNSKPAASSTSAAVQLAEFRELQPADLRVVSWTNPTNDPASSGASGEVYWSDSLQKGFMVFNDLEINDATKQQYQLWIFDKARDEALPVDGGVFDITGEEKFVVAIDAKLSISEATMFAVTIEKPGGVVQSKRERLPLLAKIDS